MPKSIEYISLILIIAFIPIYLLLHLNIIPMILPYFIFASAYIYIKKDIQIKYQLIILLMLLLISIIFSFLFNCINLYYILTILNSCAVALYFLIILNNLILKNKELLLKSNKDDLTGLFNRKYFMSKLAKEVHNHKEEDKPLCLLMLDLDYFKKCNDNCGHLMGDEILKMFAQIISNSIRVSEGKNDIAVRYGGEEFSIILSDTNLKEAFVIAEKIRKNTENFIFSSTPQCPQCKQCKKTVSIGIASLCSVCTNPLQLIDKADDALYKSKEVKNQINVFDQQSNCCKDITNFNK